MKLLCDRGGGPVLGLVCPLMGDEEVFAGQVDRLARRRRVLVFQSEGEDSLRDAAAELLSMLGSLGIRRFDLGGLSLGGAVALEAADRAPGAVRSLLLLGARHTADEPAAREARKAMIRALEEGRMEAVLEEFLPKLVSAQNLQDQGDRVRAMFRRLGPGLFARQLATLLTRRDMTETLIAYTGPVLCLAGAQDVLTPPETQRTMAGLAPHGQWGIVPGNTGHLCSLEAPAAVLGELEAFLAS